MRSAVSAALAMHGGGRGGGGGGARERWLGARGAAMLSVVFVLLRRARRETRERAEAARDGDRDHGEEGDAAPGGEARARVFARAELPEVLGGARALVGEQLTRSARQADADTATVAHAPPSSHPGARPRAFRREDHQPPPVIPIPAPPPEPYDEMRVCVCVCVWRLVRPTERSIS